MGSVISAMGSVLSAAHAALCSFVEAQLDKAEARRLMAIYPGLRDMPADELEVHLRRLIDDKKDHGRRPFPVDDCVRGLREEGLDALERRCNYMSKRKLKN